MIKVIASDMDGTLLGDDHRIAPETRKGFRRNRCNGKRSSGDQKGSKIHHKEQQ